MRVSITRLVGPRLEELIPIVRAVGRLGRVRVRVRVRVRLRLRVRVRVRVRLRVRVRDEGAAPAR